MKLFAIQRLIQKSTILPLLSALALAGCEERLTLEAADGISATQTTIETVEIDVAAPEAFSITDTALWDGRPTFGGVWVAYPDIEQPERVRIRNEANGKEIIGGLYRRERDFPGPKIQLSADAANTLGVLAGTPTELTIVALRRKTVEVVVEPEVEVDEAPSTDDSITTPLRRPAAAVAVVTPAVAPVTEPTAEIEETVLPSIEAPLEADPNALAFYIQVSTLKSKAKADIAVKKLATAGLPVEIRERKVSSGILYRIIVGPAITPELLEVMMSIILELGYTDAIVLG